MLNYSLIIFTLLTAIVVVTEIYRFSDSEVLLKPAFIFLFYSAVSIAAFYFLKTKNNIYASEFCVIVIACGVIDYFTTYIPNRITYPLVVGGLSLNLIDFFRVDNVGLTQSPGLAVIACISVYLGFILFNNIYQFLAKSDGMGMGDVKLITAITAWYGASFSLLVVFLSSCVFVVFTFIRVATSQASIKDHMPFGPSLAVSVVIVMAIHIQNIKLWDFVI